MAGMIGGFLGMRLSQMQIALSKLQSQTGGLTNFKYSFSKHLSCILYD